MYSIYFLAWDGAKYGFQYSNDHIKFTKAHTSTFTISHSILSHNAADLKLDNIHSYELICELL